VGAALVGGTVESGMLLDGVVSSVVGTVAASSTGAGVASGALAS